MVKRFCGISEMAQPAAISIPCTPTLPKAPTPFRWKQTVVIADQTVWRRRTTYLLHFHQTRMSSIQAARVHDRRLYLAVRQQEALLRGMMQPPAEISSVPEARS